jgi:predicted NBD/HSP70 family sugar kinase
VEAVASVSAITRRLSDVRDAERPISREELKDLLRHGDADAIALVKEAAVVLGGVVASLVHFYNPARVVITGGITEASDNLLAGVRSVVYEHALPLATRNLTLAHSVLGDAAGLAGGIVTGIEHVLSPGGINALALG